MGKISVGQCILFSSILGLIFGIGGLPTDAFADDYKSKKKSAYDYVKDRVNEIKNKYKDRDDDDKRGHDDDDDDDKRGHDDDDDDDKRGHDDDDDDDKKVSVCHIPPGNPENAHVIKISKKALDAHLAHGDIKGKKCPPTPLDPDTTICFGKSLTEWMETHKVIIGTVKNDRLKGTSADEVIAGGPGRDVITASGGDDIVCGGSGKDIILGGKGDDKLDGESGRDIIKGQKGDDFIEAQDLEKDKINGGKGDDTCKVDEVERKVKNCETVITPYMGS